MSFIWKSFRTFRLNIFDTFWQWSSYFIPSSIEIPKQAEDLVVSTLFQPILISIKGPTNRFLEYNFAFVRMGSPQIFIWIGVYFISPFWIFVKTWSTEEPTVCAVESFANWLHPVQSGISLTFMEKHGRPIRGTPYSTDATFEVAPFRVSDFVNSCGCKCEDLLPHALSFLKRISWDTLSKAFLKSINSTPITFPESSASLHFFRHV